MRALLSWRRQLQRSFASHNKHRRRHYYSTPPFLDAMLPRLTLLRVAVSAGTAAAGYVSYKIDEGRRWVDERLSIFTGLFDDLHLPKRRTISAGDTPTAEIVNMENVPDSVGNIDSVGSAPEQMAINKHDSHEFSGFIKKMIEIDEMLRTGDFDGQAGLSLPKIVVIGSQSSGKSSVLESIVGHSFLPKGSNMVTRRPLLLTLVNDQNCTRDHAIFPTAQGAIRIDDFAVVAQRVKEMNMAVGEGEWVSEVPVEVHIHSRNLPDLTLIDLPGYIAVHNRHQPAALRQRIAELCGSFLHEPNIILAVSAADVDLANSEALQAARRHDPTGTRTIGVVTKLDLVAPDHGAAVLRNDDYPLSLGYVGVVCAGDMGVTYFKDHKEEYTDTVHGIDSLKVRLVSALQESLKKCTKTVLARVNEELSDIRYELKTKYDDKSVTAEGYLAEVVGRVRESVDRLSSSFTRATVRRILERDLFDRHLVDTLLEVPATQTITRPDLHRLTNQLTRAGWGRRCAHTVASELVADIKQDVIASGPLCHHPAAADHLATAIDTACRSRVVACAEQIENALKPYKQPDSLEFTEADWRSGCSGLRVVLEEERARIQAHIHGIALGIGGMERTRRVMDKLARNEHVSVVDGDAAMEIVGLWSRDKRLNGILTRLDDHACKHTTSLYHGMFYTWFTWSPPRQEATTMDTCQLTCPPVYLFLLSRALLRQAALYAQDELAPDQRLRLPDLLLERHRHDPLGFARENEAVWRHVELLGRLSLLERVRERLAGY